MEERNNIYQTKASAPDVQDSRKGWRSHAMCNTSQPRLHAVPRYMPWNGTDPLYEVTESIAVLQPNWTEVSGGSTDRKEWMRMKNGCILLLNMTHHWRQIFVVVKCIHHRWHPRSYAHEDSSTTYVIPVFTAHPGNLYSICWACNAHPTVAIVKWRMFWFPPDITPDITVVQCSSSTRLIRV